MNRFLIHVPLFLLLLLAVCHGPSLADESVLKKLLGRQDAALLVNPEGKVVFAHRPDALMIPASTLKIVTSLIALNVLGPDYRFVTDFFMDAENNLYIRGTGDPMLLSEDLIVIAEALGRNIRRIHHLFLDATHFASPVTIPGAIRNSLQPYDAGVGALCVNFNTVTFRRLRDGRLESAEVQTPLVPFILQRIATSGAKEDRISISTQNDQQVLYAGHLFSHFLKQAGIRMDGEIRLKPVPDEHAVPVHRHRSVHSMEKVVSGLMAYSNNFIANQLFIACGAHVFGPPGTLAKGVDAAVGYMGEIVRPDDFVLVEGSGLSRNNRVSCRLMDRMLVQFLPHRHLMRREGNEFYKTGSLSDVQTRAGYVETPDGRLYRFVVMINTPGKPIRPVMDALRSRLKSLEHS